MNRHRVLGIVGLLLLTGAAYWPALHNGFMWDDDDHFTQNDAMTAPDGLRQIWSSLAVSRYYPLTLTTFWVQRRLWGLNPLPYHAVNIALHGVNAVLAWFVLRRLNIRGAWVAAALWAVHPVNVESIAWVTELKNVQSGLFFFASLLCFLWFERETRRRWYALSLLCFAAALLSKPSTVFLPVVLLLCAWWQRGRWTRVDLVRTIPFFAMAAAMSLLTVAEQRGQIGRAPQEWTLSLTERLAVAGRAIWFYAVKTLWPTRLLFVYPRWKIDANSPLSLLPLLAAIAVAIMLWRLRHRGWARAGLFGWACFVAALLPVLGFLDIYYFRYSFVADHFQYLAGLAIIVLVTAVGAHVLRQRTTQWLAAIVTILAAGTLARGHTHVFRDDETLWRDTMEKNPAAFLACNNLGIVLNGRGEYAQSEKLFRKALELKPRFLEARSNLGLALTELGRYPEAEQELMEALRIQASWSKAHYCLGRLYYLWNRPADSEREFRLAILAEPSMAEAHFGLGTLLQQQHHREEALKCYRDALAFRPDYVLANCNLASMLAEDGNFPEAFRHYDLALHVAPETPEIHYNYGLALHANGQLSEAIVHLRNAVDLRPTFADGYLALGKALADSGQYTEAIRVLQRGLEVEPAHRVMGDEMAWIMATAPDPKARFAAQAIQIGERLVELTARNEPKPLDTLAAAYAEDGRFDDAVQTAEKALALAESRGLSDLATQLQQRIDLYRGYQPYRLTPVPAAR